MAPASNIQPWLDYFWPCRTQSQDKTGLSIESVTIYFKGRCQTCIDLEDNQADGCLSANGMGGGSQTSMHTGGTRKGSTLCIALISWRRQVVHISLSGARHATS